MPQLIAIEGAGPRGGPHAFSCSNEPTPPNRFERVSVFLLFLAPATRSIKGTHTKYKKRQERAVDKEIPFSLVMKRNQNLGTFIFSFHFPRTSRRVHSKNKTRTTLTIYGHTCTGPPKREEGERKRKHSKEQKATTTFCYNS